MKQPATLPELQAHYGARYRWLLLAVMIGAMASIMSSTIINVAVPDMSRHFTLGQERAQWATSGFMVAMTVSMLSTPWLLARYGYRRTYASAMGLLLAGGVSGGLLVDWFGWRSIFFMVIPFCLLSLALARRLVPVTAPGGVAAGRDGHALDWPGMLLATLGTLCLLNGLVQLHGGAPAAAAGLLLGAGLALAGFLAWQRRLGRAQVTGGRAPLMNLALFARRPFAMGSGVAFIYGMALFGSTYLLPVYMQLGLSLSPSYVGTILLPAGLVLAVTVALAGRLADRQAPHHLVSLGVLLLAASFALMATLELGGPIGLLMAWAILGRVGLGFILPSLNLGAMRGMDPALIPQAASTINFLRMLGGAAGVSLCAPAAPTKE